MVKNTEGGKHKSQARKNVSSNKTYGQHFRKPENPYERYAIISKLFGGNQCEVSISADNVMRCEIRGKFRDKFKRTNTLSSGSFVLIGLREWEAPKFKIADLLHVYEPHHHAEFRELYSLATNSSIIVEDTDDIFQRKSNNAASDELDTTIARQSVVNDLEESYDAFLDV